MFDWASFQCQSQLQGPVISHMYYVAIPFIFPDNTECSLSGQFFNADSLYLLECKTAKEIIVQH